MPTIQCLKYDKWEAVSVDELAEGDMIAHGGKVAIVSGKPVRQDGKIIVPARPRDEGPIHIALGASEGMRAITVAMEYTGADLLRYEDGTAMIANFDFGAEIYSPRLPVAELEDFCQAHLDRYEAFFDENEEALDRADVVPMARWW